MIYLHDTDYYSVLGPAEKAAQTLGAEIAKNIEDISYCGITVFHGNDYRWKKLMTSALSGSILVRVSTIGYYNAPKPRTAENGIGEFHLVLPVNDVTEVEWTEILSGLSNKVIISSLLAGNGPKELKQYFVYEPLHSEILVALGVLCQAFLLAHVEFDPHSEFWGPEEILDALEKIGFVDRESYDDFIMLSENADLSSAKKETHNPSWWNIFRNKSIFEKIQAEWRTEFREDITWVERLLDRISRPSPMDKRGDREVVANAYVAIYSELDRRQHEANNLEMVSKEWGYKISEFWHDWLINRYRKQLEVWLIHVYIDDQLDGKVPFPNMIFLEWENRRNLAFEMLSDFEPNMCPYPSLLKDVDSQIIKTLLLQKKKMLRQKYDVETLVRNSIHCIQQTDDIYHNLKSKIDVMQSRDDLAELESDFESLIDSCFDLATSLSAFPSRMTLQQWVITE